ncbi:MAG: hypothetical protein ACFFCS_17870 [Candidatus Hodarchaeota archaeon]
MSSNFDVPLYYSEAPDHMPPCQKIWCSTLVLVRKLSGTVTRSITSAAIKYATAKKWDSHLVISEQGLVYENPREGGFQFVTWDRVGTFGRTFTVDAVYEMSPLILPEETKTDFKIRQKKFPLHVLPHLINYLTAFMQTQEYYNMKGMARKAREIWLKTYTSEYNKLLAKYGA